MLPKKSITRTIRKAGAHRVSKDASLELVNYLDSTTKISQKAVRYAKHARRKTVKREDIKNAILRFGPGPFGRGPFGGQWK
jgi:histone H3/H4